MRQRRRLLARAASTVVPALVAGLLLVGCHPAEEQVTVPSDIEITGSFGVRPSVTFTAPLQVRELSTTVVLDGEGPPLAPGDPVLVDWIGYDGTTGALLGETWPTAPEIFSFSEESLGEDLFAAVSASGTNDRVLLLEPVSGTAGVPGSRVVVVDVRPARAQGTPVPPAPGLPAVTLADDGAPAVTLTGEAAPATRVEQVLLKGAGAQVEETSTLIVQYHVVQWSDGGVRATTWGEGALPETVDLTTAVPGLAQGLLDQTVGSQVLLVLPPAEATGDDTLVFVVDILAVVQDDEQPETASPQPTTTPTDAPTPTAADDGDAAP